MFFLTYANMDSVASQVSGSSSVLASDWNTFVRDNFDDLKAGHVVLSTAERLALGVPVTGTMVFDSTLNILMVFNGSVWTVGSGSSLTSAQKSAIPGPTTGTMVYDSTLGVFQYYNGSGWVNLQGTPPLLSTAQKTALGTPATGTMVYDSTLGLLQMFTGSAWSNILDYAIVTLSDGSAGSLYNYYNLTSANITLPGQKVLNLKTSATPCVYNVTTAISSVPGTIIKVLYTGTGMALLRAASGVTINGSAGSGSDSTTGSVPGFTTSRYVITRLVCTAANTWVLNVPTATASTILT